MPRGDNRVPAFAPKKGPISQRELVRILPPLIDAARGRVSSATRDQARATLREVLAVTHWQTPFCMKNLNAVRCRFLVRMGYIIPTKWLYHEDRGRRLREWQARQVTR